jgi:hypothetical protein
MPKNSTLLHSKDPFAWPLRTPISRFSQVYPTNTFRRRDKSAQLVGRRLPLALRLANRTYSCTMTTVPWLLSATTEPCHPSGSFGSVQEKMR